MVGQTGPQASAKSTHDAPHQPLVRSGATNPRKDTDAVRGQDSSPFGHGVIGDVVEEQVVPLRAFGEILFRVIDDVIGAEFSGYSHVARADYSGDLGVERFRDLQRECSDTARCAVDQDFLASV